MISVTDQAKSAIGSPIDDGAKLDGVAKSTAQTIIKRLATWNVVRTGLDGTNPVIVCKI